LWHLEFEPVTQMSGRLTGCGVATILPEFYDKLNSNVVRYFPEPNRNVKEEAAASSEYSQTYIDIDEMRRSKSTILWYRSTAHPPSLASTM
jgi:hypothetical protein